VQRWLAGKVARHKHLRGGVVVVDAIPKSPTGKILRRELRERAKRDDAKKDGLARGVEVVLARL
jgi:acyl-coenzyme A synthetase/AMP-(fatty) acid ligase